MVMHLVATPSTLRMSVSLFQKTKWYLLYTAVKDKLRSSLILTLLPSVFVSQRSSSSQ